MISISVFELTDVIDQSRAESRSPSFLDVKKYHRIGAI
jgi:hypothetical protein